MTHCSYSYPTRLYEISPITISSSGMEEYSFISPSPVLKDPKKRKKTEIKGRGGLL